VIGEVTLVIGASRLIGADGAIRDLQRGTGLREGDRIETQGGAQVHVRFVDGGLISVRPGSRLVIEQYSAPADSSGAAQGAIKFRLEEGVVRSITGAWGEAARHRFRLNTPVAAIGVKGTDFVVRSASETTAATVYTGAIVVAPLTAACAATVGPCVSGAERLLSADMKGQMLELHRSQAAPQLVPAVDLMAIARLGAAQARAAAAEARPSAVPNGQPAAALPVPAAGADNLKPAPAISAASASAAVTAVGNIEAAVDSRRIGAGAQFSAELEEVAAKAATREAARLAAEAATREAARLAAEAATREAARLAAEAATREAARLAAEAATREAARLAAEAATREAARLAAEVATREAARLAAEAATREAARLAAEAATREAARLAAEAATREAARLAAEAATREAAELAAEQLARRNSPEQALFWVAYPWAAAMAGDDFSRRLDAALLAGTRSLATDGAFSLRRPEGTVFAPQDASARFRLSSAAAVVTRDRGLSLENVKIAAGSLEVDFARSTFATSLTATGPVLGAALVQASGAIDAAGGMRSTAGNASVVGGFNGDAHKAGVAFRREVPGGVLQGISLWGR
jgi:hypothetical protein